MFYHALHPANTSGHTISWWAVHAETLTPIRIIVENASVSFRFVKPPEGFTPTFQSHPDTVAKTSILAKQLLAELRASLCPGIRLHRFASIGRDKLPEHLIVFHADGTHPAVWRTTEPMVIIPTEANNEAILGQPTHWSAAIDLPATGWEYYWTECQNALEELTPSITGTP